MFGNGVFWKTLAPLEEPIKDPTVGTHFHQPTSDDVPVVEKRNYSQTFDRAPFVGVAKVDKIDRFKKRKIDRATGKFIQDTVKIENGGLHKRSSMKIIYIIIASHMSGSSHSYQAIASCKKIGRRDGDRVL